MQYTGHGAQGKPLRVEVAELGLVVNVTCHQSVPGCAEAGEGGSARPAGEGLTLR